MDNSTQVVVAPSVPTLEKARRVLAKLNLNEADAPQWKKKYKSLKSNAMERGVVCYLTFAQYVRLAKKARLSEPSEIGNRLGHYQMSRIGDTGNYEWGNCRFLSKEENLAEMKTNGGNAACAAKLLGRTKETHSGNAQQATSLRGRSAATHDEVRRRAEARRGTRKETHEFIAKMALKKSKGFKVESPSGKIYRGRNLREFCAEHDLNQGNMAAVCRGAKAHAKGWTGRYV